MCIGKGATKWLIAVHVDAPLVSAVIRTIFLNWNDTFRVYVPPPPFFFEPVVGGVNTKDDSVCP